MNALEQLNRAIELSGEFNPGEPYAHHGLLCGFGFIADFGGGHMAESVVEVLSVIRDHGPALVELIEAAQKIANGAHPWMETPVKLRFELFAAVGKLTEDKPG